MTLSLTCCENRDVCDLKRTHLSVEHTLAGGKPCVVALSLTCRENRDVCALKVTHPSVEHTLAGGKPCRRGTVFDVLRE